MQVQARVQAQVRGPAPSVGAVSSHEHSAKDDRYTDPDLLERLKTEITDGDRGGRPGQWSARKAQLLAREYEKAGGGYRRGEDADQEHLSQWTEQEWTTQDGSPSQGGGPVPAEGGLGRPHPRPAPPGRRHQGRRHPRR